MQRAFQRKRKKKTILRGKIKKQSLTEEVQRAKAKRLTATQEKGIYKARGWCQYAHLTRDGQGLFTRVIVMLLNYCNTSA